MPFDSNGTASLVPSYFVRDGDTIMPSQHNPVLEDIRSMLSNVVVRDGRAPLTGPLNANGNKITGVVDGTDPTDVASVGQAAAVIGDFKETVRTLDGKWLRRNGELYNSIDYPALSAILPPLPDGVQWSRGPTIGTGGFQTIFAKQSSGYLISRAASTGGTFSSDIYSSDDAITGELLATISGNFSLNDFSYGASLYAASSDNGQVATSADAVNWSVPVLAVSGTTPYITSITFGIGLFVVTCGSASGKFIRTSPDGINWTTRYTYGGSGILNRVRFVNGLFVAVGGAGAIITSPDAINWTSRTSGTTSSLTGITYGNSLYVAVGFSGAIVTSPTLTTWTLRASGTTQNLNRVVYSTSGFMAIGDAGTARISGASDGTSWTATATGSSLNLLDVAVSSSTQNKYMVIGQGAGGVIIGTRTLPSQFQVPNDNPTYGWIRAL